MTDGSENAPSGALGAQRDIPVRRLAGMLSSCLRPYGEILRLVWPLALGMVNNAVMQFADRAFLARSSMSALEAVLPASTLAWVFMGFFQSVVGYAGVFVAQHHGAGDEEACATSYRAGQLIALLSGLLILPVIPLGNWLFAVTAGTAEIVPLERTYFTIACAGSLPLFLQMAALSYFTGRGKTRIVFWVNLLGNLLNIALDPLLIFGLGPLGVPALGIAGAAYATVFAQLVQCVILAWAAHGEASRVLGAVRTAWSQVPRILRFGIPAGGYEILNMLSFTAFVFVTGRVGDVAFAASNACFTVNYLLFAPMMGFALGAQTLVGQHLGRGDVPGAVTAFRRTLALGLVFVAVACGLVLALSSPIMSLFAPPDPAVRDAFTGLCLKLLLLMSGWMLFDAADVILSGALKGAGDTRFVFVWMLVCAFVLWLPLVAVVRCAGGGMAALWSTMVLYAVTICVGSAVRWARGRWQRIGLVHAHS